MRRVERQNLKSLVVVLFVEVRINLFTAPACKMSGLKMHGRAYAQYIFRSFNTSTWRARELCESRLTHLRGELGSCVKVDVDVLGSRP